MLDPGRLMSKRYSGPVARWIAVIQFVDSRYLAASEGADALLSIASISPRPRANETRVTVTLTPANTASLRALIEGAVLPAKGRHRPRPSL